MKPCTRSMKTYNTTLLKMISTFIINALKYNHKYLNSIHNKLMEVVVFFFYKHFHSLNSNKFTFNIIDMSIIDKKTIKN